MSDIRVQLKCTTLELKYCSITSILIVLVEMAFSLESNMKLGIFHDSANENDYEDESAASLIILSSGNSSASEGRIWRKGCVERRDIAFNNRCPIFDENHMRTVVPSTQRSKIPLSPLILIPNMNPYRNLDF